MRKKNIVLKSRYVGLLALAGMLAACSGSSTPPPPTASNAAAAAEDAKAVELSAREQDLARREAELAAKEQETEAARLQAEEAARQESEAAAAKNAPIKKVSRPKPTPSKGSGMTASASAPTKAAPPAPVAIQVPAGTQLTLALSSDLSTKTSTPGDAFEASLVSDLMVNNRVAVPAGARVTGTVTDVISGSNAIGATPMLGLKFNHIEVNGQQIPISGEINEQGKSEKVQDTAKILGGVAAGAVLGHQVKTNNRGKVIGGLLGGAIGAVAAKKTGSEVQLASGSTLTIALGEGFTVYHP